MEREFQTVTTELMDNELAAVSGGYTLENCMISGYVVARPGGATSTGTGSGTAGWDIRKSNAA